MKRFFNWKIPTILLVAAAMLVFNLPTSLQPSFLPNNILAQEVNLGLDLQGGSQLDYKIDLRDVPESDKNDIIEGVIEVINKRVNRLGVSEPNIYESKIGDENHIIVELAGIKDLEEAKSAVGKTIQLEFKIENDEVDQNQKETVRQNANNFLNNVVASETDFEVLAEQEEKANPGKVLFETSELQFKDQVTGDIIPDKVFNVPAGTIIPEVIEDNAGFVYQNGTLVPKEGFFVTKVLERIEEGERKTIVPKEVTASHILISYEGAERAAESVTRTKEEARELANDVLRQTQEEGADFGTLAASNSDEPNANTTRGRLSEPVKAGGSYAAEFTEAALKLENEGQVTDTIVETAFGFHVIKAESIKAEEENITFEPQVRLATVSFSTTPDPWKPTELTGQYFDRADVQFDHLLNPIVGIQFDAEGAKLFEELTEQNINKQIAIFVGGELISAPVVNDKISGGQAVITGSFTVDQAQELARDLNTGAIPAPITLTGQYTIGASLGQEALQTSLKAGLIGLALLLLYMLAYYRVPGLMADIALAIYATVLMFLIKVALPMPIALLISLVIFFALVYKIMKNKEPGLEKTMSLFVASFALFFFAFLLSTPVVLTLAGVAGVILSIGMAVDANVLIFERIKEEIQNGRSYKQSVEVGFERAWSSIRDSNFSSLITCAILYYFGSSIIRGFALNLAAGILISMFTAITITRAFMNSLEGTKIVENPNLLGFNRPMRKEPFKIISRSKVWLGVSSVIIAIGLVSMFTSGIKTGIDFRGGTLMDIQFPQEIEATQENILESVASVQEDLNTNVAEGEIALNLGEPTVISSGDNAFIIRMEFIDEETHNMVINRLKSNISEELEETRFTTIGPLISQTLKSKAVVSLVIALFAIILYISFAFRHIPKEINPWKFGAAAIVALTHDVLITLSIFSVFQLEIDALFITALLTIIGFSVHDTIVVMDRIRENLKEYDPRKETFDDVCDKSLTQTMARSINTSVSTLLTLGALVLLGSESIFTFVLALVIGVVIGTYSSIFIASPVLSLMTKKGKVK
jgi:SecD/SecF fusion protein